MPRKKPQMNNLNTALLVMNIILLLFLFITLMLIDRVRGIAEYRMELEKTDYPALLSLPSFSKMMSEFWIPIHNFGIRNRSIISNVESYNVIHRVTQRGLEIFIEHPCLEFKIGRGNSMKPFWEKKSIGIIDRCFNKSLLDVGDVIVFISGNDTIQHRISDINYEYEYVVTVGDNNNWTDGIISFDDIQGKVIGFLNVLGDE